MSRFEDPCIVTCSISGAVANREQCPAIPYTPEEYGAEARRIVDEGGTMIHIHARKPDGTPSGVRAWMWIIEHPSPTARFASAAYSSGV